jgi:hypothetical protein
LNNGHKIGPHFRGHNIDDPSGFNFLNKNYKIPVKVIANFVSSNGSASSKEITAQASFTSSSNNAIALLPTDILGKTLISVGGVNAITTTLIYLEMEEYTVEPMQHTFYYYGSIENK